MRKRIALLMVAACALVALACGSDASDDAAGEGMETVSHVTVTLGEFSVTPVPRSVPAGIVRFVAANGGPADPHELVIFKTDLPINQLQDIALNNPEERGFLPEGGVAGLAFIGEIEEFEVGEQSSGIFELEAGNYVLICNIVDPDEPDEQGNPESHFLEGMSVTFTVN